MAPNTTGPDPGITDQIREALATAYGLGASQKDAAAYAGIPDRTLRYWLHQGHVEGTDPAYHQLAEELRQARAAGIVHSLGVLVEEKAWQAHAKRLAIIDPESYSERRIEQKSVDVNHYLHVSPEAIRALSDDEVAALREMVAKMEQARGELVEGEVVEETDVGA